KYVIMVLEQPNNAYLIMVTVVLAYGALWVLNQLIGSLRELCGFRVLERTVRHLHLHFLNHLNQLSIHFHTSRGTGALTNALEKAQTALAAILYGLVFMLIPTVIEILIAATILWQFYGLSYGMILLWISVIFITFSLIGAQKTLHYRQKSNSLHRNVMKNLVENLINFEQVRYFGNQDHEVQRHDAILQQKEEVETKSLMAMELLRIGQVVILGCSFILLLVLSARGIYLGKMGISDFVLINGLALQFVMPLSAFGNIFREVYKALTDLEHVFTVFDAEPERTTPAPTKLVQLNKREPIIHFDEVTFGYDIAQPILHNISFTIHAGERIAFVGDTGVGKSTIAKLLYRFYDINKGTIWIQGKNIQQIRQIDIAHYLSIVPQRSTLFNESIYYNIAYGNLQATQYEIEQAARIAHIDEFINSLPQKYQTPVGENGIKLSGGERQRIGIARALLRKSQVYIFDEATSSLDSNTEAAIQNTIAQATRAKTSLIISHRLSTVVNCDRIVVLNKGRIVEVGQHEALLEKQGYYASLWQNYHSKFTKRAVIA
ncbi:MAG: ATP-binding cassette domain-containing protein, partial [Gammaproteobacteria bacterium]